MLWFCGWSFIYYVGLCYLVLCFPPKDTRKMSLSLRKIRKMRVSLYFSPSFSSLAVCHSEHRSYSEGLHNEHTRSHSNIVFNWRQPATSSLYVVPICCVWQCACVCFQIFPWAWDYFDWQVQSLVTTILVFTDVTRICHVGIAIATASGIVSPWFQRDAMFRHLILLFCQSVSQSESIWDACYACCLGK